MKAFIVFLLFLGAFFIMQGIYEQKVKSIEKNKRIEYRFIPRTYLEEQMSDGNVSEKMQSIFGTSNPWFERNVTLPKTDKILS